MQLHNITRRILIWGALLFLFATVQTGLLARLAVAIPGGAVPDLLLASAVAIAIFDSEKVGAVAGIAAGYIAGALGGVGLNLLPLCYMLCAYVCGIWSTMSLSANFPSWVVYMLASGVARAMVTLVEVSVVYPGYVLGEVAASLLWPEFIATLLLSPVVYFAVRRASMLFNRRVRFLE